MRDVGSRVLIRDKGLKRETLSIEFDYVTIITEGLHIGIGDVGSWVLIRDEGCRLKGPHKG